MQNLIFAVVLLAVGIGTYTDVKTREIPDWLTYGLAIFGIGANLILSITQWTLQPLLFSLAGAATFFAIASLLYYTGQWGGGDSKLLIGIAASFGLPVMLKFPYVDANSFIIAFSLNLLITSMVYSILFAAFAAVKHRKKFTKELKKNLKKQKALRRAFIAISAIFLLTSILIPENSIKIMTAFLAITSITTAYLFVFSKSIENACMLQHVSPTKLTEGDWIAKDVIVEGKKITGPKDLGITKPQLAELQRLHEQKKIKTVLIKTGIPLIPSFLAATILTWAHGNLFSSMLTFFKEFYATVL